MSKKTIKTATAAYENKQEIEARINALLNAQRQTISIVIEHTEAYFRTLAIAPEKPAEAFAVMNAITANEAETMNHAFCADCQSFNDVLLIRENHRLEIAVLKEQLSAMTEATESRTE